MELVVLDRPQSAAQQRPVNQKYAELAPARIRQARRAFATRRVDMNHAHGLLTGSIAPARGDLVLARVEKLGQHTGLQRIDGRRAKIFPGDEIIVAYGARYAPNQFESYLPEDLGPCHLVAAGGMASMVSSKHRRIKQATQIKPLGLIADESHRVLNLRDYALAEPLASSTHETPVIAFAGTAMDAGKTTAAADFIRGLTRSGFRVGAAKVTGTGACGDYFFFVDSGAEVVIDFTDFGYGSTFGIGKEETAALLKNVVLYLEGRGVDVIVLEIADGLLQRETGDLLASPTYAQWVDSTVFCASDALGAAGGVDWLEHHGLHVSAIAGSLSAAPLAVHEASAVARLPVLNRNELSDPAEAIRLLGRITAPLCVGIPN